jgi:tRNA pseudouridine13 synthase
MLSALPEECSIGINYFISDHDGIGGQLRNSPEDFCVSEIEFLNYQPLSVDASIFPHLIIRATLHNWDTNSFSRELSRRLKIPLENISWAGTKDKRALTTQLFSIKTKSNDYLPLISGATTQPLGRFGRQLNFGDLNGNIFDITVHDPSNLQNISKISDDLKIFGQGELSFPNYFGHQRFGSLRTITHIVGLCIARKEWKRAVLSYIGTPSESEPIETQEARKFVQSNQDWEAALSIFPSWLSYERNMLKSLIRTGGDSEDDYETAIRTLPRNLQMLLIHAVQSYLFNNILTLRLRENLPFQRAIIGDIVCFSKTIQGINLPNISKSQIATKTNLDSINRHLENHRAFISAPLIGFNSNILPGIPGELAREVLLESGLSTSSFDLPKPFGSSGSIRPILSKTNLEIKENPLKFSFTLPPGSYATSLLREYLKVNQLQL